MLNEIHLGDCLDVMTRIPSGSVDMILCDLPYGATRNKWDSIIPLEPLWAEYRRVIKPNGAIVLTAQAPFDKVLGASNLAWFRYEWIWKKNRASGFLGAKRAPLKDHENVLVFYRKPPTYHPQFSEGKPYIRRRSGRDDTGANYGAIGRRADTVNEGRRYPKTVMAFEVDPKPIHPTQKPVALFEYLIRTYTNPGETVLDNCIGSGTTAIAALNTGRNFIGIEQDAHYVEVARRRVEEARA